MLVSGWTALHHAVANEQVDMVTKLLERGANPNVPDKHNVSPLSLAVQQGKEEVATALGARGTEPLLALPVLTGSVEGVLSGVCAALSSGCAERPSVKEELEQWITDNTRLFNDGPKSEKRLSHTKAACEKRVYVLDTEIMQWYVRRCDGDGAAAAALTPVHRRRGTTITTLTTADRLSLTRPVSSGTRGKPSAPSWAASGRTSPTGRCGRTTPGWCRYCAGWASAATRTRWRSSRSGSRRPSRSGCGQCWAGGRS